MTKVVAALLLICAPAFGQSDKRLMAPTFTFTPPACSVAPFSDVPANHGFCRWIKQLQEDGITSGCGGGRFCIDDPVSRGQMAIFMETAMRGTSTWSPWQGVFKRTILVNADKSVSNLDAGTALIATLNGITDSNTYAYVVKLEPRGYELGSATLTMKPNVTLEGSGRENTIIASTSPSAAVTVVDNSTLRNLKIVSVATDAKALSISGANGVLIESCELEAFGPMSVSGLYNSGGSFTLRDSVVTAQGAAGAIVRALHTVGGSSFRIINSDVRVTSASGASTAIALDSSTPGSISGGAIQLFAASSVTSGKAVATSADLDLAETRIEAGGAATTYGVHATGGTLYLRHARINILNVAGVSGVGAALEGGSTAWINGCSIEVSVPNTGTGIVSSGLTHLLATRVKVTAAPASATGIVVNAQTVAVDSSSVESAGTVINAIGTIRVGGSFLGGTTTKTGVGTATCISSWDEGYAAVAPNCV